MNKHLFVLNGLKACLGDVEANVVISVTHELCMHRSPSLPFDEDYPEYHATIEVKGPKLVELKFVAEDGTTIKLNELCVETMTLHGRLIPKWNEQEGASIFDVVPEPDVTVDAHN